MHKLTLSEIQQRELELLVKFDRICKENNLKYSLAYGTLIGAIRHNGFIPWDDDVDVLMPRGDYEKFISLRYSDSDCELMHFSYTDNYGYKFAKLVDNKTIINEPWRTAKKMGLFIDVFPMDFCDYNSGKEYKKLAKKCIYYQFFLSTTFIKPFYFSRPYFVLRSLVKPFCLPFKNFLFKKNDSLTDKAESGRYTVNAVEVGQENPLILDSSIWNSLVLHKYEDFEFYIFEEYDYFLRNKYGDYMTPPAKEYQKNVHGIEAYYKSEY